MSGAVKVDFSLTSEQLQLGEGAARFMREHSSFDRWRKVVASGAPFDRANWRRMAELGWLAINVPEADGGLGGSPGDTMVLMQAFGARLALEPFVSACVIAPSLLSAASSELRARTMPAGAVPWQWGIGAAGLAMDARNWRSYIGGHDPER